MKFALTFVIGLLFGALLGSSVALMFAPSTGEEMRTKIKSQVETQSVKAQEKWQLQKQQVQHRFDKKNGDVQVFSIQAEEVE
jgi:gas vesicle protein